MKKNLAIFTIILMAAFGTKNAHSAMDGIGINQHTFGSFYWVFVLI